MRRNIPVVLLIVCFLAALPRAFWMVRYVQFPPGTDMAHVPIESCQWYVHEAGYGAIAIGVVATLVLLVPFRRREPWSWWAIAALVGIYAVPTLIVPVLSADVRAVFQEALAHSGVERHLVLENLLPPITMLTVLAIAAPSFFRKSRG